MIIGISGKIGSGKDTVGQIIQYLTSPNGFGGMDVLTFLKQYEGRTLDCEWEIKKFADKLKDIVCLLIGCTREQLEDREFKEADLGEEWRVFPVFAQTFASEEEAKESLLYDSWIKSCEDLEAEPNYVRTPRSILQLLGTDCGREIIHPNIWVNSLMADYWKHKDPFVNHHGEELPNWLVTDTRFPNEAEAIAKANGLLIRVNRGDGNTGDHPSETSLDDFDNWSYVIDNNGSMEELVEKVREILVKENII